MNDPNLKRLLMNNVDLLANNFSHKIRGFSMLSHQPKRQNKSKKQRIADTAATVASLESEQKVQRGINKLATPLKKLIMSFLSVDVFANLALANKSFMYAAKSFIHGMPLLSIIQNVIAINEALDVDHHSTLKKKKEKTQVMSVEELKGRVTQFTQFTLLSSRIHSHDQLIAVLNDDSLSEAEWRKKLKAVMPVFYRTASILQKAADAKQALVKAQAKLDKEKSIAKREKLAAALQAAQKKYDQQNELLFFVFQLNTSRISILLDKFLKIKSLLDDNVDESTLTCIKRLAPAWNNYHARFFWLKNKVSELNAFLKNENADLDQAKQKLQAIRARLDEPMLFADASGVMTTAQYLNVDSIFSEEDRIKKIVARLHDILKDMKTTPTFFQLNIKNQDLWATDEALNLWGFTQTQLDKVPAWQMGANRQYCYLTSDLLKARLAMPWIAGMKIKRQFYTCIESLAEVSRAEHLPEIVKMIVQIVYYKEKKSYWVQYCKTPIGKLKGGVYISPNANPRFEVLRQEYSSPEGQFLKEKFMRERSGCPLPVVYSYKGLEAQCIADYKSEIKNGESSSSSSPSRSGYFSALSLPSCMNAASANGAGFFADADSSNGAGSAAVDSSHSHAAAAPDAHDDEGDVSFDDSSGVFNFKLNGTAADDAMQFDDDQQNKNPFALV